MFNIFKRSGKYTVTDIELNRPLDSAIAPKKTLKQKKDEAAEKLRLAKELDKEKMLPNINNKDKTPSDNDKIEEKIEETIPPTFAPPIAAGEIPPK